MNHLETCYCRWDLTSTSTESIVSETFGGPHFQWKVKTSINDLNNYVFSLDTLKAPYGKIKVEYCVLSPAEKPFIENFEFNNDFKSNGSDVINSHVIIFKEKDKHSVPCPKIYCNSASHVDYIIEIFIAAMIDSQDMLNKSHSTQILKSILLDTEFQDLTIKVGSTEMKVHKSVLASASPVFRGALTNDTLEKKTNCIVISDFEVETIKKLIDFIYSGFVDIFDYDMGFELLRASDRYDIHNLKLFCSEYLKKNVNKNNVLSVLLAADINNSTDLKEFCMDFFLKNLRPYSQEEFEEVLKMRPELLAELFSKNTEKCSKHNV